MESVRDREFVVAVEAIYHLSRHAFLSGAHRWMMFLTIVCGASAVVTSMPWLAGLLAATTGAADIAFDFVGRAQAHADIRRKYLDLAARIARDEQFDFAGCWMMLSAEEPPLYRAAEQIAHRNACIALRREVPAQIGWYKRLTAHLWRW